MKTLKDYFFYLLVYAGAGLVLYLSWRSHPQMAEVWFIPRRLALWADENRNDTIRTAVPFLLLGGLIGGRLALQNRPLQNWVLAWSLLAGVVTAAEVGQLFIVKRAFDFSDILWGSAGALGGLATAAAIRGIFGAVEKGLNN